MFYNFLSLNTLLFFGERTVGWSIIFFLDKWLFLSVFACLFYISQKFLCTFSTFLVTYQCQTFLSQNFKMTKTNLYLTLVAVTAFILYHMKVFKTAKSIP